MTIFNVFCIKHYKGLTLYLQANDKNDICPDDLFDKLVICYSLVKE